jgi:hypothetical protein
MHKQYIITMAIMLQGESIVHVEQGNGSCMKANVVGWKE